MNDEFYIGYRKIAPPRLARFVAAAAILLASVVVGAGMVIGGAQQPAGDGRFAFGRPETFEGTIRTEPFLHLEINGDPGAAPARTNAALIVGRGKHGAPDFVTDAAGKRVRLRATRIERHGQLMLEADRAETFEMLGDAAPTTDESSASPTTVTLVGELVDTKCYLGVMNPGQGKVHRGCAAECLRGGVPPGLLIRDPDGGSRVIVLRPRDESVPPVNPEWAARKIRVIGELKQLSDLSVLSFSEIGLAD